MWMDDLPDAGPNKTIPRPCEGMLNVGSHDALCIVGLIFLQLSMHLSSLLQIK